MFVVQVVTPQGRMNVAATFEIEAAIDCAVRLKYKWQTDVIVVDNNGNIMYEEFFAVTTPPKSNWLKEGF